MISWNNSKTRLLKAFEQFVWKNVLMAQQWQFVHSGWICLELMLNVVLWSTVVPVVVNPTLCLIYALCLILQIHFSQVYDLKNSPDTVWYFRSLSKAMGQKVESVTKVHLTSVTWGYLCQLCCLQCNNVIHRVLVFYFLKKYSLHVCIV